MRRLPAVTGAFLSVAGAVGLLCFGNSPISVLSVLALPVEGLPRTEPLPAVFGNLSMLAASAILLVLGWKIDITAMIRGGRCRGMSPGSQWLRLVAGCLLTGAAVIVVLSLLRARAGFNELAMSATTPSSEQVTLLANSGLWQQTTGLSLILFSSLLFLLSDLLPSQQQPSSEPCRVTGSGLALLVVSALLMPVLGVDLLLLYLNSRWLAESLQGERVVYPAELARSLTMILQSAQWYFMGLTICGLLQALLPFIRSVESPENMCKSSAT